LKETNEEGRGGKVGKRGIPEADRNGQGDQEKEKKVRAFVLAELHGV